MKKILALIFVGVIACSVAGCGGSETMTENGQEPVVTEKAEPAKNTATEVTETETDKTEEVKNETEETTTKEVEETPAETEKTEAE